MNTQKGLLSIAIATALLSGCGSSDSSSDSSKQPSPVVLNDAQKLALGKQLITRIDDQAATLVAGGATVAKQLAETLDTNGDESVSEDEAEIVLIDALDTLLSAISPMTREIETAKEDLLSDDLALDQSRTLDFAQGGRVYNGSLVVSENGDTRTFSFDVDISDNPEWESEIFEGKLLLTIASQSTDYTAADATDPANWRDQLVVNASLVNGDTHIRLVNMQLEHILQLDEENLAAAQNGSSYAPQATKVANSVIESLTATDGDISVSAALNIETLTPLLVQEDDSYAYSTDQGSFEALDNSDAESIMELVEEITAISTELVAVFSNADYIPSRSLNLKSLQISNLTAAIGDTTNRNQLSASMTYRDADAELFNSGVNSRDSYDDRMRSVEQAASYTFSEDLKTLTLTNMFGSAIYRLEEQAQPQMMADGPDAPVSYLLTCERQVLSDYVRTYVGFETWPHHCSSSSRTVSQNNLKDWLAEGTPQLDLPGFDTSLTITNIDEVTAEDAPLTGYFQAEGIAEETTNSVLAPVTYQFDLEGSIQLAGETAQAVSASINHPAPMDYQIEAQLGEAEQLVKVELATLSPTVVFSSKVGQQGSLFDASITLNITDIQELVNDREFSQTYEDELKASGVVETAIADIMVDGLDIGDVILYRGNLVDPEEEEDMAPLSALMSDSSRPREIALGVRFADGDTEANRALFEDTSFLTNVAEFSYVETCSAPTEPTAAAEAPCERSYFPGYGVLFDPLNTLEELFSENMAPYSLDDLELFVD